MLVKFVQPIYFGGRILLYTYIYSIYFISTIDYLDAATVHFYKICH